MVCWKDSIGWFKTLPPEFTCLTNLCVSQLPHCAMACSSRLFATRRVCSSVLTLASKLFFQSYCTDDSTNHTSMFEYKTLLILFNWQRLDSKMMFHTSKQAYWLANPKSITKRSNFSAKRRWKKHTKTKKRSFRLLSLFLLDNFVDVHYAFALINFRRFATPDCCSKLMHPMIVYPGAANHIVLETENPNRRRNSKLDLVTVTQLEI